MSFQKTYQLKVRKWVFAVVISGVNILSAYVTPYLVGKYVPTGLDATIANSLITLGLNGLTIYLSVEENNVPTIITPYSTTNRINSPEVGAKGH